MTQTLEELGRLLVTPPEPGSVTNYHQAHLLERSAPNTMNAWTHVVPLFVKLGKRLGKRTIFGRDKGAEALKEAIAGLRLVVLGLYGDGKLHTGATDDACLLELTRSLVAFKEVFPNWMDAYLTAEDLLLKKREGVLPLLSAYQRSVEAELIERGR